MQVEPHAYSERMGPFATNTARKNILELSMMVIFVQVIMMPCVGSRDRLLLPIRSKRQAYGDGTLPI
jgi:hypothetical protein